MKTTKKRFSRLPVDLTLEQRTNVDAASQKTGIGAKKNSISARQRWTKSNYIRRSIISHLFKELKLTKKEGVSSDVKPNRIKKIQGSFGDTNFNHQRNNESVPTKSK